MKELQVGGHVLRGLSNFGARTLALILLMVLILPTISRAEDNSITVEIMSEDIAVRGETFILTAHIKGDAQNVVLRWQLPQGFELVNGSLESKCETLDCQQKITVNVTTPTKLGPQDVGVDLTYA